MLTYTGLCVKLGGNQALKSRVINMNIQIPNGSENPTVIVVNQGKANGISQKNPELLQLEKKFEQKYRSLANSNNSQSIENIQKAFVLSFGKLLRENNTELVKAFMDSIGEIKTSLDKVVSQKPKIVRVNNSANNDYLTNALDDLFNRLQKSIDKARPRLIPSPS